MNLKQALFGPALCCINLEEHMKLKKLLSLAVVLGMVLAIPVTSQNNLWNSWDAVTVFIASESGRDNAQNELDDVNDKLNDLEDDFDYIEGQLSQKAQLLSDLLADKEILENDIAKTQVAIDQAKIDLENAKIKEQESYELMMVRIQYMYENSTQSSIWDAIINSTGIADLLNRVEYINEVHNTDRELLEEYKAIVHDIEVLSAELESNMNNLVAMQEVYEHQEIELENALAELEAEAEDFRSQIAAAEARASELADYIEEQNRLIEEEERLKEEQEKNENNKDESTDDGDKDDEDKDDEDGDLTDSDNDPDFSTDVSGAEVVNYALKFVGNPYKWGGNSLTEGCDCSGFVNQVFKHFGISVPRQSQAFKTVGKAVSFDNLKAGDIVVYPGHVAIYIGNGCIVEAQSSSAGITSNRSVKCSTITAIRRVL